MKKIISIILTILTLFSLTVTSVSAKSVKKDPKTYYAVGTWENYNGSYYKAPFASGEYTNSKGTASIVDGEFVFTDLKGKKHVIEKSRGYKNSHGLLAYVDVVAFYVRLDKIYYQVEYTYDKYSEEEYSLTRLKISSLDGKTKKVLHKSRISGRLLGGYGSSMIYYVQDNISKGVVYKYSNNGKVKKLFERKHEAATWDQNLRLFNGKIYHDNKVYNLKTGKTKSFVASQLRHTKKYLYYINKNGNLKRLDKQGNRQTIDSKGKITRIGLVNDGQTVVYCKGTGNNRVFYRRTGVNKEAKRLVSMRQMLDMMELESGYEPLPSRECIDKIILHDNKVYFDLAITRYAYDSYNAVFSVGVNGNNLTANIITKPNEADFISVIKVDGKIKCTVGILVEMGEDYGPDVYKYEYYYF